MVEQQILTNALMERFLQMQPGTVSPAIMPDREVAQAAPRQRVSPKKQAVLDWVVANKGRLHESYRDIADEIREQQGFDKFSHQTVKDVFEEMGIRK